VSEALRANPYCGDVFVFRSKRMDRVKLLAWDGSGMVLVTQWLHQGRFTLPRQRLRSIPQTTFARKPQTRSQNLGKPEYCQKPNQRCSSRRSLFFTDD
jgi:transposase